MRCESSGLTLGAEWSPSDYRGVGGVRAARGEEKADKRESDARYRLEHRAELREKAHRYSESHREEKRRYHKRYAQSHPIEERVRDKRYREKLRREVFSAYGGFRCACPGCGVTAPEFLSIDHINGGGHKHRQTLGADFYKWLRMNNFPPGFQVLCYNCNHAKGIYGKCPHESETFKERMA